MPYHYQAIAKNHADLFEQLGELLASGHGSRSQQETLTHLKNKANRLLKSEEVIDAYIALGILASLEGQIEQLHANYKQALHRSPYLLSTMASYASSLAYVGYFSEAADLMLQAYHTSENKSTYLDDTICFCGIAGRFHQIGKLLLNVNDTVSRSNQTHRLCQLAEEVIAFMDEKEVGDEELEKLIKLTMSVLHQHHIYVASNHIQMSLFADASYKWFHYGVLVPESVETVLDLDVELASKIDSENLSKNLTSYFIPILEAVGGGKGDGEDLNV